MRAKRIAAVATVGALLGGGSLLATAGAASASDTSRARPVACPTPVETAWPASANGRPAGVDPKIASGVFMWHDGRGWHIRATHRKVALSTFAGKIETTGRFVAVTSVRLEGRDVRRVSADRHTITFRFDNHGAIDGLNFRTVCAPSITFTFGSDGSGLPPVDVTIGRGATHPASDPFTIDRVAASGN